MALFSKRHYEWLAHFAGENLHGTKWVQLADRLQQDNPKLNRDQFIHACRAHCTDLFRKQFEDSLKEEVGCEFRRWL